MQVENDYHREVYNGDIGYVVDLDLETGELTVIKAAVERRGAALSRHSTG
jgi:ATP-dependent exoDNAse (exonuclease V) alpha subunit